MSAYHLYLSKLLIIWPQKALESSKAAAHVDEPYAFQCLINSVRTGVKADLLSFGSLGSSLKTDLSTSLAIFVSVTFQLHSNQKFSKCISLF